MNGDGQLGAIPLDGPARAGRGVRRRAAESARWPGRGSTGLDGAPWSLLREGGAPRGETGAPDVDVEDAITTRSSRLLCRNCGHGITTEAAVIEVGGSTDHVFENPHGIVFHVRCFADAPGTRPASPPSSHYTWFSGYAWQVAVCSACGVHLGWAFTASSHRFWGLIPGKLVTEAE